MFIPQIFILKSHYETGKFFVAETVAGSDGREGSIYKRLSEDVSERDAHEIQDRLVSDRQRDFEQQWKSLIDIVDLGDDLADLEVSGQDLDTAAADTADMSETLTVEETAELLCVSTQRVRAMLSSSLLNGRKRGGVWFISAHDVFGFARKTRKAGRPRK